MSDEEDGAVVYASEDRQALIARLEQRSQAGGGNKVRPSVALSMLPVKRSLTLASWWPRQSEGERWHQKRAGALTTQGGPQPLALSHLGDADDDAE